MKKRIYIAGKISDFPIEVYTANFKIAALEAQELGFEPVQPIHLPHDHNKEWISYMREDIKHMIDCDAVYAQGNWRESKGATIEVNIALMLGIPVIYQRLYYSLTSSNINVSELDGPGIMALQETFRNKSNSILEKLKEIPVPYIEPIIESNNKLEEYFINNEKTLPVPVIVPNNWEKKSFVDKLPDFLKPSEYIIPVTLEWNCYPVGTIAPAIMGGHWYKTDLGWKWNGPDGVGGTFPTPGGDNSQNVILPEFVRGQYEEQKRTWMLEGCPEEKLDSFQDYVTRYYTCKHKACNSASIDHVYCKECGMIMFSDHNNILSDKNFSEFHDKMDLELLYGQDILSKEGDYYSNSEEIVQFVEEFEYQGNIYSCYKPKDTTEYDGGILEDIAFGAEEMKKIYPGRRRLLIFTIWDAYKGVLFNRIKDSKDWEYITGFYNYHKPTDTVIKFVVKELP